MWKKAAITAAFGAAVVGAGGAALAAPGAHVALAPSTSSAASDPAASTAAPTRPSTGAKRAGAKNPGANNAGKNVKNRHGLLGRINRLAHATWVTKAPRTGEVVTHDAIHGDVTAVSASSITVRSADGVSQTYVITKDTKVRVRAAGRGSASTISKVSSGDHVLVAGTGTSTLTAKRVVAGLRR